MNHILLSELSEHVRQTAPCVSPTYVHSGPSQSPQLLPKEPADPPANQGERNGLWAMLEELEWQAPREEGRRQAPGLAELPSAPRALAYSFQQRAQVGLPANPWV